MSSRDVIFSVSLHVLILVATIISIPMAEKRTLPFDEVIRVNLTAPSALPGPKPTPISTPAVPTPVVEESVPEAPVTPPKPKQQEAVIDKKPEKKPEPKPKPKPKPAEEAPQQASPQTEQPADGATSEQPAESPGGSSGNENAANVGEGSPFGGATVDNASFDYPYWFTQAFNKIAANWHNRIQYPGSVVCVVYFQVISSGRVIDLRIEQSSGIPEFDDACMTAVSKSTPFPPLPKNFVDEIIGITIPFKYDPR